MLNDMVTMKEYSLAHLSADIFNLQETHKPKQAGKRKETTPKSHLKEPARALNPKLLDPSTVHNQTRQRNPPPLWVG